MSTVINKATGQILKSVHTPNYKKTEYIINPTQKQINNILKDIPPVQSDPAIDIKSEIDNCSTLNQLKTVLKTLY